jgi:O-antigen ligase
MTNYGQIITALGLENFFRLETLQEGSGRLVAWDFAWQNVQKSFFIGKGFAYDEFLMRSNSRYLTRLGHEGGVHNTYLILWLNTGFIGLLLFLRGFLLLFIRASKFSSDALPIMFVIMFSIMFEPWLAASLNPFTIIFLTVATLIYDNLLNIDEQVKKSEPVTVAYTQTVQS